ncbi:hypothetical protein MUK42_06810 [Musa troglodytarum]|uniref:Uncharacterized protein n=1 Tax=Musa troglodytarum TaxID=320322 RepID=A0A9E7KCX8_9LILI|nr:hypothetical protein MUK42_06810 [Musa troglodytarum]
MTQWGSLISMVSIEEYWWNVNYIVEIFQAGLQGWGRTELNSEGQLRCSNRRGTTTTVDLGHQEQNYSSAGQQQPCQCKGLLQFFLLAQCLLRGEECTHLLANSYVNANAQPQNPPLKFFCVNIYV